MSPKISKATGPSYSEGDPRYVPHGDHREVEGEDVDRAALNTEVGEPEQAQQSEEQRLGGLEEVQSVEDDYDDTTAWSYADLQAECKDRQLDGPVNVARDDLIARLREDDASRNDD